MRICNFTSRAAGTPAAKPGYIALLSVLILGAATTAISLGLLTSGGDVIRTTTVEYQSIQARAMARACAEEALQQINDNINYTATVNLTISDDTCSALITNTGSRSRTILSTGTVSDVVKKIEIYVTIKPSSISITSWQEIA